MYLKRYYLKLPQYRIFFKDKPLLFITGFFVLQTLWLFIYGKYQGTLEGFSDLFLSAPLLLLIGFIGLWISFLFLNSCVFPIIKFDKNGLTAYFLFKKKVMRWNEIKSTKLVNAIIYRPMGRYAKPKVQFRNPGTPENIGTPSIKRTGIFLIISKDNAYMPQSKDIRFLFKHSTIAIEGSIAFE